MTGTGYRIGACEMNAPPPAPGLYLVPTPIGHLKDITLRALEVLAGADVIWCEDTRVSGTLLRHYGIGTPLRAYHDHNAARMRPRLLAQLAKGEAVALISDAGMPLISDPGFKLVRAAIEAGHDVHGLPGPSAPLVALSLSGLPGDRFLFAGFTPARQAARRRAMEAVKSCPASLIFFESARRLAAALADMATVLGPRPAAVARELTKRFEEVRRGRLDELAAHYAEAGAPKGEIVIIVGPPENGDNAEVLDDVLTELLAAGVRVRDAAGMAARRCAVPRQKAYARALALRKAGGDSP